MIFNCFQIFLANKREERRRRRRRRSSLNISELTTGRLTAFDRHDTREKKKKKDIRKGQHVKTSWKRSLRSSILSTQSDLNIRMINERTRHFKREEHSYLTDTITSREISFGILSFADDRSIRHSSSPRTQLHGHRSLSFSLSHMCTYRKSSEICLNLSLSR